MINVQPLDYLPIWGVYVVTLVFLLLGIELGFRLSNRLQKRRPDQSEASVGPWLALLWHS